LLKSSIASCHTLTNFSFFSILSKKGFLSVTITFLHFIVHLHSIFALSFHIACLYVFICFLAKVVNSSSVILENLSLGVFFALGVIKLLPLSSINLALAPVASAISSARFQIESLALEACVFICDCIALLTAIASLGASFTPSLIFCAILHTVLAEYPAALTILETTVGLVRITEAIAIRGSANNAALPNQPHSIPDCT
jgi:hypothetical protein